MSAENTDNESSKETENLEENDNIIDKTLTELLSATESSDSSACEDFVEDDFESDIQLLLDKLEEKPKPNNKTFSEEQLREIERRNSILMDKILKNNRRPNQYGSSIPNVNKVTSAEINRRRRQTQIDRENTASF